MRTPNWQNVADLTRSILKELDVELERCYCRGTIRMGNCDRCSETRAHANKLYETLEYSIIKGAI